MATLGGIDCFHLCTCRTEAQEYREQLTRYPRLYGTQRKRMGGSGFLTVIEGELIGDALGLNIAETFLRNLIQLSATYTLVDNYGNIWPDVYLKSVTFDRRVEGGYPLSARKYVALLVHLT